MPARHFLHERTRFSRKSCRRQHRRRRHLQHGHLPFLPFSTLAILEIFSLRIFSNLTESMANLRIPSDNLSLAIWDSFIIHLKVFSSMAIFSMSMSLAALALSFGVKASESLSNSFKSLGLMVNKSQPVNSFTSPVLRKLAPMTTVL